MRCAGGDVVSDRPPLRRPEFDAITTGWGSDACADLGARIELATEWVNSIGGRAAMTPAERKVLDAMLARHFLLEGVPADGR